VKKKDMEFYGVDGKELDGIVSQLRLTAGVEVALFLYELDTQKFKVSMRSNGDVDVSKIAVFFGGSWKDGVVAALIGMVFAFIDPIQLDRINQFAKIAMQSFVGGLLSCVAVRFGLGDDVGMIMIGTIMILIPGVFFCTALRDLLCGDFLAGTLKTVQALLSTLMIAFGYLLAMLLVGGVV
jgi:uncharacterized membrane protein YjjB (DUF3815 family)